MANKRLARHTDAATLMDRVQSLIGDELREVERVFLAELASRNHYVRETLAHLMAYRGKRLRPMLLLLTALACGGIDQPHRVLAAVVEMIHTATLVHDDVLDEATTRRHVATINTRWSNETSVLLGDYLFTHAYHLTSSLGDAWVCRAIGRATNIVCEGEMAQIAQRGNLELTEERYLDIIEAKTAELCALSCALGARYAGANSSLCDALDAYGRSLGIAFQIADDLLDLVGEESSAGKSLGTDLQKGKLTLPLIYLLAQAPPASADRLRGLLVQPDGAARERLCTELERNGALDYARSRATEFSLAARQQLAALPETPARLLLEDLAEFAARRAC